MARCTSERGAIARRTTWPEAFARVFAMSGLGSDTAIVTAFSSRVMGTARCARATVSGRTSTASGVGVVCERSTRGMSSCSDKTWARPCSVIAPSSTKSVPIRLPDEDCWRRASASWAWVISCAPTNSSPSRARELPGAVLSAPRSSLASDCAPPLSATTSPPPAVLRNLIPSASAWKRAGSSSRTISRRPRPGAPYLQRASVPPRGRRDACSKKGSHLMCRAARAPRCS